MIRRGIHPSAVIDWSGEISLPKSTIIEPGCVLFGGPAARLAFGEQNTVYPNCVFRLERGFVETGDRVSFGPGCLIYETRGGLRIGDHSLIAGGVKIAGVNHGYADAATPIRDQAASEAVVVIGRDVWIGMGVVILPGVHIGDGAVIGAGSVVTGNVEPRTIGVGVPFRVTGRR